MKEKEFFRWLAQENLLDYVTKYYPNFQKIFVESLKANNEDVLIIGDLGFEGKRVPPVMMACYYLAAKKLKLKPSIVIQEPQYITKQASEGVIEALLNFGERNIICMALSGKLGSLKQMGKSFRRYIRERKHRFVSTPSLEALSTSCFSWVARAINVDYEEIHRKGKRIKEIFDSGNEIHVRTRAGTDLHYNIKGMKAINNSGRYCDGNTGGNMPAGEVYIPCNKSKVEGVAVIDASIKTERKCIVVKNKVRLNIEKGSVTEIKGKKEAELLKKAIEWAEEKSKYPENVRLVGEFGLGINPNAKVVGSTLINEKALGTAHIALGSNYWFGGSIYSLIHFDQVFYEPITRVDNSLLNGSFLG